MVLLESSCALMFITRTELLTGIDLYIKSFKLYTHTHTLNLHLILLVIWLNLPDNSKRLNTHIHKYTLCLSLPHTRTILQLKYYLPTSSASPSP